jgi:tetratricopeptide (TPR) repeat protein
MQLDRAGAEALARASAAAFQAGRAAEAREGFDRLAASGQANAQIFLMLAYACRQLGDMAGAGKAADEVLRRDEANLRALIVKGDALLAGGDDRAGASFHGKALKLADQIGQHAPDLAA